MTRFRNGPLVALGVRDEPLGTGDTDSALADLARQYNDTQEDDDNESMPEATTWDSASFDGIGQEQVVVIVAVVAVAAAVIVGGGE